MYKPTCSDNLSTYSGGKIISRLWHLLGQLFLSGSFIFYKSPSIPRASAACIKGAASQVGSVTLGRGSRRRRRRRRRRYYDGLLDRAGVEIERASGRSDF